MIRKKRRVITRLALPAPATVPARRRAKREHVNDSQLQMTKTRSTVLYVPYLLDSGSVARFCPGLCYICRIRSTADRLGSYLSLIDFGYHSTLGV